MSNTKRASATTPVKIVSRWDSEVVLFCADIHREVPMHKRIMEAVMLASKSHANLRYANLQGADLRRADLQDADLQGANLRYANLQGADLQGADLQGANLQGANLQGASMIGAVYRGTKIGDGGLLKRASRSDDYDFLLFDCEDGQCRIAAGCRWFTLEEAWRHWSETRDKTPLGEETFDILVMFEHHAARRAGKVMEF